MATVNWVTLKHHKKQDGTTNIKIRVTHESRSVYIDTLFFVRDSDIRKTSKGVKVIKDDGISGPVDTILIDYRAKITKLGPRIKNMTAKQISEELTATYDIDTEVNFGEFCRDHIAWLRSQDRNSSADSLVTVYNSLVDYFGTEDFPASEITARMLRQYELYLKSPRIMYRKNQFGKTVTIKRPGVTSGLFNYMRDLRLLFNAARDKFNDEDKGIYRIPHYPFSKYKIGDPPAPAKRNLTARQVVAIRDAELQPGTRAEFARDMFMLSFYLCGMNAKDFYSLSGEVAGRMDYNRSKTKGRRRDGAFISVNIPDVAVPLLKKHVGNLNIKYSHPDNLNSALNKGLKVVGSLVGVVGLTFYHARHSFGNLARNECRFSKDDVALAMNHVDQSRKTTDTYIAPDWKIVDEVQAGVLGLLLRLNNRKDGV